MPTKNTTTNMTQIALRLPVPLLQAIDAEAARLGLERASWLRMTLTQATKPTTKGAAK